jgi:biopolymer transport protein ExbB/TolQ
MNDWLSRILLAVSNALLIPVMAALVGFLAISILHLGGVLAEWIERHRKRGAFARLIAELTRGKAAGQTEIGAALNFGFPRKARLGLLEGDPDKELDDTKLGMDAALSRLMIGIRLGPMLGLMGTLIPLGPGLVAMSQGDIATLSNNLVIAFTTTVAGLASGGVDYLMHTIRRRWYARDLGDLEYLARKLKSP